MKKIKNGYETPVGTDLRRHGWDWLGNWWWSAYRNKDKKGMEVIRAEMDRRVVAPGPRYWKPPFDKYYNGVHDSIRLEDNTTLNAMENWSPFDPWSYKPTYVEETLREIYRMEYEVKQKRYNDTGACYGTLEDWWRYLCGLKEHLTTFEHETTPGRARRVLRFADDFDTHDPRGTWGLCFVRGKGFEETEYLHMLNAFVADLPPLTPIL
jgi:hypothetical protein